MSEFEDYNPDPDVQDQRDENFKFARRTGLWMGEHVGPRQVRIWYCAECGEIHYQRQ